MFSTGEKKIFLTILAAAKVIEPVTEAEGIDFDAADFKVHCSWHDSSYR